MMGSFLKNRLLYGVGGVFLGVVLILFLGSVLGESEKKAYIKTDKVYNEFQLKKELERKFEATTSARQSKMDSLKKQVKGMRQELEKKEGKPNEEMMRSYRRLQQVYQSRKERGRTRDEKQADQYNERIWNQLNSYIEDFGEERGYDIIYGSDGSGNLMYADERLDITEEVTEYVNRKYSGKDSK